MVKPQNNKPLEQHLPLPAKLLFISHEESCQSESKLNGRKQWVFSWRVFSLKWWIIAEAPRELITFWLHRIKLISELYSGLKRVEWDSAVNIIFVVSNAIFIEFERMLSSLLWFYTKLICLGGLKALKISGKLPFSLKPMRKFYETLDGKLLKNHRKTFFQ